MDEPEHWKRIPDAPLYEVSNLGRVRRVTIQKAYVDSNGYLAVRFWGKNKCTSHARVHRLVAKLFLENPDAKPEVNHMDGDKLNCRQDNLEWVTRVENQRHMIRMGLRDTARGERAGLSKLKNCQVRCIRQFHGLHWRYRSMARHFGVTNHAIQQIMVGNTWKHLKIVFD